MKIEWEFYRKYKAFDLLPRITFWWGCGPLGIDFSWINWRISWSIEIEFHKDNNTCR